MEKCKPEITMNTVDAVVFCFSFKARHGLSVLLNRQAAYKDMPICVNFIVDMFQDLSQKARPWNCLSI